MGQDIIQYTIGNLFVNIFLAFIVSAASLQGAASYTTNGTGLQNTEGATNTYNALSIQYTDDMAEYSACPETGGCDTTSKTIEPSVYDPILALFNFASILGKAITFITTVLYNYMTWGFFHGTAFQNGPTILFGFLIMAWNITTWYLFLKFILGKSRMGG